MLTVKYCCCGCSLKGGTCTLLILSLIYVVSKIFGIISGKDVDASTIITSIAVLLVSVAGLYGIQKEKPAFIVPFIIQNIISFVYAIYVLLILIFYQQLIYEIALDAINEGSTSDEAKDLKRINAAFFLLIAFIAFFAALQFYFSVVVYSYYRQLKQQKKASAPPTYA